MGHSRWNLWTGIQNPQFLLFLPFALCPSLIALRSLLLAASHRHVGSNSRGVGISDGDLTPTSERADKTVHATLSLVLAQWPEGRSEGQLEGIQTRRLLLAV